MDPMDFSQHASKFPAELNSYFSLRWDKQQIWELDLPARKIRVNELLWLLELPFWSTRPPAPLFDLKPADVLRNPDVHPSHWQRSLAADLTYPIATAVVGNHIVILDGMHRLVQAVQKDLTSLQHSLVPDRYLTTM